MIADKYNQEITASDDKLLPVVNSAIECLFRRQDGIDLILHADVLAQPKCYPILHIYSAIMAFFSFSQPSIERDFTGIIEKIESCSVTLNQREGRHFLAIKQLQKNNIASALDIYLDIVNGYPLDLIAILMLETCAFLTGKLETLKAPYEGLLNDHSHDPDFIGSVAFYYCHAHRKNDARELLLPMLEQHPHNAWLQHVYAHTLDELDPKAVQDGVNFLQPRVDDWPKQNRFFEGHNWMHLHGLFLKCDAGEQPSFVEYFPHIWGAAKSFLFEQNNAFIALWLQELNDGPVDSMCWKDLADHAIPFEGDYFTPYLTTTTILAIAKDDLSKALMLQEDLKLHVDTLPADSSWREPTLNALEGCLQFIQGNVHEAYELLSPLSLESTRSMGHSDEQRAFFIETAECCQIIIKSSHCSCC